MESKYRLWTLADIARLPEECLGKFYAELPHMVAAMRPMIALAEDINGGQLTPLEESDIFGGSQWVDDEFRVIKTIVKIDGFDVSIVEKSMDH